MRFFVDAQFLRQLARWLQANGHETLHARDLPEGNRTGDAAINALSLRERQAVITNAKQWHKKIVSSRSSPRPSSLSIYQVLSVR